MCVCVNYLRNNRKKYIYICICSGIPSTYKIEDETFTIREYLSEQKDENGMNCPKADEKNKEKEKKYNEYCFV